MNWCETYKHDEADNYNMPVIGNITINHLGSFLMGDFSYTIVQQLFLTSYLFKAMN